METQKREARERLPEIKEELTQCISELMPTFVDYSNNVAFQKTNNYHFSIEDTAEWRDLYGDEVAENIHRLCSYGFKGISFGGENEIISFYFNQADLIILYFYDALGKAYPYKGCEDLGDGWYLSASYSG